MSVRTGEAELCPSYPRYPPPRRVSFRLFQEQLTIKKLRQLEKNLKSKGFKERSYQLRPWEKAALISQGKRCGQEKEFRQRIPRLGDARQYLKIHSGILRETYTFNFKRFYYDRSLEIIDVEMLQDLTRKIKSVHKQCVTVLKSGGHQEASSNIHEFNKLLKKHAGLIQTTRVNDVSGASLNAYTFDVLAPGMSKRDQVTRAYLEFLTALHYAPFLGDARRGRDYGSENLTTAQKKKIRRLYNRTDEKIAQIIFPDFDITDDTEHLVKRVQRFRRSLGIIR